jgi:hypothetical protein
LARSNQTNFFLVLATAQELSSQAAELRSSVDHFLANAAA